MKLQRKSCICSVMLWFKVQANSLGCGVLTVHSNLFNHCSLLWTRQTARKGSVIGLFHFTVNFPLISPNSHKELF